MIKIKSITKNGKIIEYSMLVERVIVGETKLGYEVIIDVNGEYEVDYTGSNGDHIKLIGLLDSDGTTHEIEWTEPDFIVRSQNLYHMLIDKCKGQIVVYFISYRDLDTKHRLDEYFSPVDGLLATFRRLSVSR